MFYIFTFYALIFTIRGIEWSLRAVRLFLQARAVIDFSCEQRALGKLPAIRNISLLKHCFVPINLADTFKAGQQTLS